MSGEGTGFASAGQRAAAYLGSTDISLLNDGITGRGQRDNGGSIQGARRQGNDHLAHLAHLTACNSAVNKRVDV